MAGARASASGRAAGAPGGGSLATRPLRLALAGGGTGGHVVPGLHLLRDARARLGEQAFESVLWFGAGRAVERRARRDVEALLGPAATFRAVDLPLEPEGGGAPSTRALLLRTAPAARLARVALRAARCDVVCGLGGFTSLPVVLAARSLGIPVALLEINAVPGRATRWLAPLVHRVLHAWPATVPPRPRRRVGKPGKDRCIGPPLGPEFVAPPATLERRREGRRALGFDGDRPVLAVLGGSQGAAFLNRCVARAADALERAGIDVLHQVGPGRLAEAAAPSARYRPVEFVDRVERLLGAADLVLCRGGASTLAEVAAAGVPAVVVPYPHHRDGHQRANARALGDGVLVVEERDGDAELLRRVTALASDPRDRARRGALLRDAIPVDGARRLFDELALLSASRVSHD
jgi:UDP-N-acetylglucosamine--N-acetylmuramyl-(pentapeptide) pyrophosphoryl-undecaprenol N-acetylglucosamine transferase